MKKIIIKILCAVALTGLSPVVWCAQESELISQQDDQVVEENNFNFDFKIIVGAGYVENIYLDNLEGVIPVISLALNLDYYRFFLESNSKNRTSGALDRSYIGYHLWRNDNSNLDIVMANYAPAIEKEDKNGDAIIDLVNLSSRDDDSLFGLRYSYLTNNTYWSIEGAYDLTKETHQGWAFETYLGKVYGYNNWEFTYGVGADFYTGKVADYYLSVKPEEVAGRLYAYQANSAYTINVELSAQYPVSENWVFEAGVSYSWLSDQIAQSPLVVRNHFSAAILGFSYVF